MSHHVCWCVIKQKIIKFIYDGLLFIEFKMAFNNQFKSFTRFLAKNRSWQIKTDKPVEVLKCTPGRRMTGTRSCWSGPGLSLFRCILVTWSPALDTCSPLLVMCTCGQTGLGIPGSRELPVSGPGESFLVTCFSTLSLLLSSCFKSSENTDN